MGKRKRSKVVKPWCWYCERDFEDVSSLLHHQKAKHFKCPQPDCRRTFQSIWKLSEHTETSHSLTLESIPNALPHRNDMAPLIIGMDGIPETDFYEHEKQILGDIEVTKPKGPSYGELSVAQLRSQVAEHQASIQSTNTSMGYQQPFSNYYTHGLHHSVNDSMAYSHNSYYMNPPRSNISNRASNGHPPQTPLSPTIPPPPLSCPPSSSSFSRSAPPAPPPPPPPPESSPSMSNSSPPPPPPPPPIETSTPPPLVTELSRTTNTSTPIHSLPTPSSINGSTSTHHRQQHVSSGTTPNLGSAIHSVSPSTRDRLTSRKPTKIILVYPYEDLSPDELRAAAMSKS